MGSSERSTFLIEDGPRGEVELGPAEQARGHEQRRVAEAKAAADQRLEQGTARAGDARRHVSAAPRACRRCGCDRLDESRFVAPRRRPDPLPPPVGEGGKLTVALDRHRCAAVAPPVGQVVGAAPAEDLGGQLLGGAGIARLLPLPRAGAETSPRIRPSSPAQKSPSGSLACATRASLATGASPGLDAPRPLRTERSLLEATCTRQTSSSSSGRTLRMCGSLTGASYS